MGTNRRQGGAPAGRHLRTDRFGRNSKVDRPLAQTAAAFASAMAFWSSAVFRLTAASVSRLTSTSSRILTYGLSAVVGQV